MNAYAIPTIDWRRALLHGIDLAAENTRRDVEVHNWHVMWELLKEAAETSRTFAAPPRSGYPVKSMMPDAPDEVTQWHLMAAYVRGELEDSPATVATPPRPSAEQVSRADAVLHLWHAHALTGRRKIKRAVYLKACGVPDRKVRAITGETKARIHDCKVEGMKDMLRAIGLSGLM